MVGLLRSSPGTGTAIVVPLGLTLLAAAFPAGGGVASLASGSASRASGSLPDRWSVALAGQGVPGYRGLTVVSRSTGRLASAGGNDRIPSRR
jgi:hypothetical protein